MYYAAVNCRKCKHSQYKNWNYICKKDGRRIGNLAYVCEELAPNCLFCVNCIKKNDDSYKCKLGRKNAGKKDGYFSPFNGCRGFVPNKIYLEWREKHPN